jgi:uncharacterized sporulation protein YeaH/YhbH (DUF444 family)
MPLNIDKDLYRFRHIVKGRIRKDLKRFMSSKDMIGKEGDQMVRIPLPQIQIPRLRYGENPSGVGQGEGEGEGEGQPGQGDGKAGDKPGEHSLEVEVSFDELAQIMGEELELPNIQPKGQKEISSEKDKYTGISRVGPESLRHTRRTFKQALKRQISSGTYKGKNPIIVPIKEDKRYRSWKPTTQPMSNAVILYMMDVSGSMGKEQKEIVRTQAFWLDLWLKHQYKNVETRFIIHDAAAKEVDRHTFFHTRESGGTLISAAYKLCLKIMDKDYPAQDWNIYPFHFSDGDNWSGADTSVCLELLEKQMLPRVNQFSYAQVESQYGSGQFLNDLVGKFDADDRVAVTQVPDSEGIMNAIKELLGKGR